MSDATLEQESMVLLNGAAESAPGDIDHASGRTTNTSKPPGYVPLTEASSAASLHLDGSDFAVPRKPVPVPTTVREEAPHQPEMPVKPAEKSDRPLWAWWWELAACIVAIAALLAVAVTLVACQGRPLPNLPFRISINALISVYTVIMKASLASIIATGLAQLTWKWFESDRPLRDLVTFDQARHDTFGALFLIWQVNFQQVIVSLGAVLALVSLAIDPFTQQLIHYVGCNETVNDQSFTIPRTSFYQSTGAHTGAGTAAIPPDIQASVNAGIFAGGLPPEVSCQTGNCTMEHEYGSVGYCSSCEDITHLMEFEVLCSNDTVDPDTTTCPDGSYPSLKSLIPDGTSTVQVTGPELPLMTMGLFDTGLQILMGKSSFSTWGRDPFTGLNLTGCDDPATNDTWRCRQYGAVQCVLSPCARTYTADMMAGTFHEHQIAQTPVDLAWGFSAATPEGSSASNGVFQSVLDLGCINDEQHSGLLKDGYEIPENQRWLPYNISFPPYYALDPEIAYPQSLLADQCIYVIDEVFVGSLWSEYLYYFLNGTVSGEWGQGTIALLDGPQALQTIYNFGQVDFDRINGIFNNISLSMTNAMRVNGNQNHSAPAQGEVLHYAICLKVEWGWIAFPAALVTLALIFCALVIFTTRRSDIWKSNPLAMVYRGPYTSVDQTSSTDHDASRDTKGMESAAQNLMVRIDRGEGRLRIAENQVRKRTAKG